VLQCSGVGSRCPFLKRYCLRLKCVAVRRSVLQCVAVDMQSWYDPAMCCNVLQFVAVSCSVLQCLGVSCSVLPCVTEFCSVLQCAVWDVDGGMLHYIAVCFSVMP